MSAYIAGAGSAAWAGTEQTYGAGYYDNASLINLTSESLAASYNRLDEGTLLASKTRPAQDLGSVDVSGGISSVLKYDFIQWLLKSTLGIESSVTSGDTLGYYKTGYTTKKYTLAAPGTTLPSSWLRLLRGTQGFDYDGLVIGSTTFDCTAQDFVKADINFNGRKETYAGPQGVSAGDWTAWNATKPSNDTVGSYKCTKARLFSHAAAGTDTDFGLEDFATYVAAIEDINWNDSACPAQQVWDVSRTQLTIDNGLEDVPATYCSGLYGNEPTFGQRSVTINCEVPYSASFEAFRQANYAKEDADNLALLLAFSSKETHTEGTNNEYTIPDHEVIVIIPNVSFDSASANVGGQGLINGSFTGTALSVGEVEPITILVRDKDDA